MDSKEFLVRRRGRLRSRKLAGHAILIQELRAQGFNSVEISEYLLETFQLAVSPTAVRKHIASRSLIAGSGSPAPSTIATDREENAQPPRTEPLAVDGQKDLHRRTVETTSAAETKAGLNSRFFGHRHNGINGYSDGESTKNRSQGPVAKRTRGSDPMSADELPGFVPYDADDPENRADVNAFLEEERAKARAARSRS